MELQKFLITLIFPWFTIFLIFTDPLIISVAGGQIPMGPNGYHFHRETSTHTHGYLYKIF